MPGHAEEAIDSQDSWLANGRMPGFDDPLSGDEIDVFPLVGMLCNENEGFQADLMINRPTKSTRKCLNIFLLYL